MGSDGGFEISSDSERAVRTSTIALRNLHCSRSVQTYLGRECVCVCVVGH